MRILLDECINPRLRLAFPGDSVRTVAEMGWRALTNGRLMETAAPEFDVFVTLDQNLQFQNKVGRYQLGIVVVISQFNHVAAYRPQFAEIRDVVRRTKGGQVNVVRIR